MSTKLNLQSELTAEQALCIQGELYSFSVDISLAAGASHKIGFTSPKNLMFLHARYRTAADRCRVYLYEDISFSGGTSTPLIPRNRQLAVPAASSITQGVTATTNPANAFSKGVFGLKAAGELEVDDPLIFKKNTNYIMEFINDATSQQDTVSVLITCCEFDQA